MAPKSSKKARKSGFYYFMMEIKEKEEAKGRKFMDLQDVLKLANPIWSNMTIEERQHYHKKASLAKVDNEVGRHNFNSFGHAYIDVEARVKQEPNNIMFQTIRNTVQSLNRKTTLLTHKFYLCHVNYFYKSQGDYYSMAEIALSEFNLCDGLLRTLHFFVDPGEIPMGLRAEVKDWAEKTHGIPYDWNCGEKDYFMIYLSILNFLRNGNSCIPPVYTMPDSINSGKRMSAVKSALSTLCMMSNENPNQFRVYPFPQLFYEIRNKCAEIDYIGTLMPSVSCAQNEIEKDTFLYAKNLACRFHEERDLTIHCSLSIVKRWVYTICDHCCKHVGIGLILGNHCPVDVDVDQDYKYIRRNKIEIIF